MPWEKVFISYASEDLQLAQTISTYISRIGIQPYIAERRPTPDVYISDKIALNIMDSNCFVAILTRNSLGSQWVNQEVGFTYALQRFTNLYVPIFLLVERGLQIRGFLEAKEHIPLDLYKFDDLVYTLIASLRAYINRHFAVLREIAVTCKLCKFPYRVPLPTQSEINDDIQKNFLIITICPNPNCRVQNNLNPKTFDVVP